MITLMVSELKEFMSRAGSIKSNKIIPIYDFVKVVCKNKKATLIKASAGGFVMQDVEAGFKKDCSFLIKEDTLSAILSKTTSEKIQVVISEKTIKDDKENPKTVPMLHITDDVFVDIKVQSENPDLYMKIEIPSDNKVVISQEVLESLFLAQSFSAQMKEINTWMSYIHVKGTGKKKEFGVLGTDGHIMYFKKFKGEVPDMILEQSTCRVIGRCETIEYSTKDNWHYFNTGKTIYGYIKPETIVQDYMTIVNAMQSDDHFTIEKKRMCDWSDLMLRMDGSALYRVITIKDGGKKAITLEYNDEGRDVSANCKIDAAEKNSTLPRFDCNASLLVRALENLPYEKVQFNGPVAYSYFITSEEDKDFLACIRQLVPSA